MSKEEGFKLVDEEKIPGTLSRKRAEWLRLFKRIPRGKAWATTEKELGVTSASVHTVLYRYVREGLLPNTYRVVTRTTGGTKNIFIINTAKTDQVLDLEEEKK